MAVRYLIGRSGNQLPVGCYNVLVVVTRVLLGSCYSFLSGCTHLGGCYGALLQLLVFVLLGYSEWVLGTDLYIIFSIIDQWF